jgi:ArsR family transcriptional regulator
VIAIDRSLRMLQAVQEKIDAGGFEGVEPRRGDAAALPLDDASVDAAFAHVVLQYLAAPADAVAEMARVVRPGGSVVAADFLSHENEWMREELGVVWLGFAPEEVERWFAAAGLVDFELERADSPSRGRDLPATFIASGRRPQREPSRASQRSP